MNTEQELERLASRVLQLEKRSTVVAVHRLQDRLEALEAKVSERYERAFLGVRDEAELLRQARWHATVNACLTRTDSLDEAKQIANALHGELT